MTKSRTRVIDEDSGRFEEYYQCGSCKGEHTFADEDLFIEPNFDFMPIFGPSLGVIFKRWAAVDDRYKVTRPTPEMWGGPRYMLRTAETATELQSFDDIRDATDEGRPLVAQTEIWNEETALRAVIEYPVKTMNILDERRVYQVDTGPVAFPDLSTRREVHAHGLKLAFIAFNRAGFSDFVIEEETPVCREGQTVAQVHHYSKIISVAAENRLYALDL